MMNKKGKLHGIKFYDICIASILILVGLIILYPLYFVIIASVSDPVAVNTGQVLWKPVGLHWEGYKEVLKSKSILTGYRNTIIYTTLGTAMNIVVTMLGAFVLSRRDLVGRKIFNWYIAIPMWFGGGLIPSYLTMHKLGLVGEPIILLLMGLVSSFNLIVARTFVSGLPYELQEAAKIDGASDFQIMGKVIMPLCSSVIAVLTLYYAVGHWNSYFGPMIYIDDSRYQVLQVFLREILVLNQNIDPNEIIDAEEMVEKVRLAQTLKYSLIVVSSLPLMILYPMLQKYFAKAVLVGSVKG